MRLDEIAVARPCAAEWKDMVGDDKVRFCRLCRKNVYDLSSLSRPDAEAFVARQEGRTCVRFYRRADGRVLTTDCGRVRDLRDGLAAAAITLLGIFGALQAVWLHVWVIRRSQRPVEAAASVALERPPAPAGEPAPIAPARTPAPPPRVHLPVIEPMPTAPRGHIMGRLAVRSEPGGHDPGGR